MIDLDQVLSLYKKVEAAVEKIKELNATIEQLKAENAALLREKAELSKALSDKTGLVSSLEAEQSKIEDTILQALEQLNIVENSIIDGSEGALQKDSPLPKDAQLAIQKPLENAEAKKQEISEPAAEVTPDLEVKPTIHFEFEQPSQVANPAGTSSAAQADVSRQEVGQTGNSLADSEKTEGNVEEQISEPSDSGDTSQFDIF